MRLTFIGMKKNLIENLEIDTKGGAFSLCSCLAQSRESGNFGQAVWKKVILVQLSITLVQQGAQNLCLSFHCPPRNLS